MKAILKYDYEWTEKDEPEILVKFHAGVPYEIVHTMKSNLYVGNELIVIIKDTGNSMSVSSHPDYVTIIGDAEAELIDKLRWEGIGE